MMEITLFRPNRLCSKVLIVDGIGSSGKGMLSHLFSCLTNVEKQNNHTVFDYVSYLHWMKKMSDDAAITYFQIEADMQIYHLRISRDVNFRPKDSTGVKSNAKPWRYLLRLLAKEGDSIVEDINRNPTWLNEAPHDAARNIQLFLNSFGTGLFFNYIMRDPEDLAADWLRRGFGNRIGRDQREFQLTFQHHGKPLPLHAKGVEDQYDTLSEQEKVASFIAHCATANLEGLKASAGRLHPGNFAVINFQDLVERPTEIMHSLSSRIGEEVNRRALGRQLTKESLPRTYKPVPLRGKSEFTTAKLNVAQAANQEILFLAKNLSSHVA